MFEVSRHIHGKGLRGFSGEAKLLSTEIAICSDIKFAEIWISRNGTRNLFTGMNYIEFNDSNTRS